MFKKRTLSLLILLACGYSSASYSYFQYEEQTENFGDSSKPKVDNSSNGSQLLKVPQQIQQKNNNIVYPVTNQVQVTPYPQYVQPVPISVPQVPVYVQPASPYYQTIPANQVQTSGYVVGPNQQVNTVLNTMGYFSSAANQVQSPFNIIGTELKPGITQKGVPKQIAMPSEMRKMYPERMRGFNDGYIPSSQLETLSVGNKVPLNQALSLILPDGWEYISEPALPNPKVSWKAGENIVILLDKLAKQAGVHFVIDWDAEKVYGKKVGQISNGSQTKVVRLPNGGYFVVPNNNRTTMMQCSGKKVVSDLNLYSKGKVEGLKDIDSSYLNLIIKKMNENPNLVVILTPYTGMPISDKEAQKKWDEKVRAIKSYLVINGIASSRVKRNQASPYLLNKETGIKASIVNPCGETIQETEQERYIKPFMPKEEDNSEKVFINGYISDQKIFKNRPADINEIVYGAGKNVRLDEAIAQMLPFGYRINIPDGYESKRVYWTGGKSAGELIRKTLLKADLGSIIHKSNKEIEVMKYALKEGSTLSKELVRWGKLSGYKVFYSLPNDYPIKATVWFRGDFKDAVRSAFKAYQSRGVLVDIQPKFSIPDGTSQPVLEIKFN